MSLDARRSWPFQYYVFAAQGSAPTEFERASGAYLGGVADAHYLQQFFEPLYESHGIGISTSDDEVISGAALQALEEAVARAMEETQRQREVTVGLRFEPSQRRPGPPIIQDASRDRVLKFLEAVASHIRQATAQAGSLHVGGGG